MNRRNTPPRVRRLKARAAALALAGFGLASGSIASAQTAVSWKAAASGSWTDPTRWNPAVIPNNGGGNTFNVTIGAAGAAYTVSLTSPVTVNSFTLNSADATLAIDNNSSLITQASDTIQAGTVALGSTTASYGAFYVGGGSTLTIAAGATISGNGVLYSNGDNNALSNAGTIATSAGQSLTVGLESIANTGTFSADGVNTTLTAYANQHYDPVNNVFVNGIFANAAGGLLTATNGATLTAGNSATDFSNAGSIVADGGTVNLGGNEATAQLGSIAIQNGGVVGISGQLNNAGATLSASTIAGGPLTLSGGTVTGGTVAAGGLAYAGGGTLSGVSLTGGLTLSAPYSSVTLSGGTTVSGNLVLAPASGYTQLFLNQDFTLNTGQTATLGSATASYSYLYEQGGHTLTVAAGATITGYGAVSSYGDTNALSNAGTIAASAGQSLTVGLESIANTGTISADGANTTLNAYANQHYDPVNNVFVNGIFANAAGGLLTATNGAILTAGNSTTDFTNAGSIVADGGTVNLGGNEATAQLGSIAIRNGGVVGITGQLNNAGATLSASTATGGPLTLSGGGTVTGGTVAAGGLAYAGNGTLSGVSLTGGLTLSAAYSSVTVTGSSVSGDVTLSGPYSSATLTGGTTVSGNLVVAPASGYAQLFLNEDYTLAAGHSATLGSGTSSAGYLYEQGGHTLTVAAGATITGYGGVFSNGDTNALSNAGTIAASAGQSLTVGLESIANTGTISADGANTTLTAYANQHYDPVNNVFVNGIFANAAGGLLTATNGATLTAGNSATDFSNAGSIVADGGTVNLGGNEATAQLGSIAIRNGGVVGISGQLNNAGATLSASTIAGGPLTLSGGTVTGGTVAAGGLAYAGGGTLSGVAVLGGLTLSAPSASVTVAGSSVSGDVTLSGPASSATLTGGTTVSGNLVVAPASGYAQLFLNEDYTLAAGHSATLGSGTSSAGYLYEQGGHTLTVAAGATITGYGVIYSNGDNNALSNAGTIATSAGQSLTVGLESIANTGTFSADGANTTLTAYANQHYDPVNNVFVNGTITNAAGGLLTATNGATLMVGNGAGNFTNAGTILAGAGSTVSVYDGTPGAFTNYNAATHTLAGGTYRVAGVFQFEGANIATNAASITLTGASAQILDATTRSDALANFAVNGVGASLTLNSHSITTPGNLSNAGAVILNGSTLALASGNYTQTGGSTTLATSDSVLKLAAVGGLADIRGGSFTGIGTVIGSLRDAGILGTGAAAGTLTVVGNETQTAAGVLNIKLGGPTAGTGYDVLVIGGAATLGGTLNISVLNGFTPYSGEVFRVITFGASTGTFAAINGLDLGNGISLKGVYNGTDFSLVTVPEPGAWATFAIGLGSAGFFLARRRGRAAGASAGGRGKPSRPLDPRNGDGHP